MKKLISVTTLLLAFSVLAQARYISPTTITDEGNKNIRTMVSGKFDPARTSMSMSCYKAGLNAGIMKQMFEQHASIQARFNDTPQGAARAEQELQNLESRMAAQAKMTDDSMVKACDGSI